jgi:hypothetical protein
MHSALRRLARRARALFPWPQLELFSPAAPAPAPAHTGSRWEFSRPWYASPHLARARRELDLVRDHFPELDDVTVRVGLTKRRSVLGLASLGETPMIWIRPRRIHRCAIAHELTHLLQARKLLPGGEKTCDVYTLARSPLLIDIAPFYLKVPERFHEGGRDRRVPPAAAAALHAIAREATAGRSARAAIICFEKRARASLFEVG